MIEQIVTWNGITKKALAKKVGWPTDGYILGVSHEGIQVENADTDWTPASFVKTKKPLQDDINENLEIEIEARKLIRVGTQTGISRDLLSAANKAAGTHGINRLGVVEDRIKGTKCQGTYEALRITLIGQVFWQSCNTVLDSEARTSLMHHAHKNALHVYCGSLFSDAVRNTQKALHDLRSNVSGVAYLTLRAGVI